MNLPYTTADVTGMPVSVDRDGRNIRLRVGIRDIPLTREGAAGIGQAITFAMNLQEGEG